MAAWVSDIAIAAPTLELTGMSSHPSVAANKLPPSQIATSEAGNPEAARYCDRIAVRPRKRTPGIIQRNTGTVAKIVPAEGKPDERFGEQRDQSACRGHEKPNDDQVAQGRLDPPIGRRDQNWKQYKRDRLRHDADDVSNLNCDGVVAQLLRAFERAQQEHIAADDRNPQSVTT